MIKLYFDLIYCVFFVSCMELLLIVSILNFRWLYKFLVFLCVIEFDLDMF